MVFEETNEVFENQKTQSLPLILSFLAGGVIGAFAGYYITKKKMREEKEREIADITSYYGDLHTVSEDLTISVEPIEPDDHPKDDLPPEDKPYPISQQEYVEDMDFHKETVVYYEKDDILTDMFDREIPLEDTIGREVLSEFDKDEEDMAYARNEKVGTDYEVILEHKSFAAIMGENMED